MDNDTTQGVPMDPQTDGGDMPPAMPETMPEGADAMPQEGGMDA